jgi:hypothetical protein
MRVVSENPRLPRYAAPVERVHFGGPDRPFALRNLLQARIEGVPAGGEIVWITYYFRDERLAAALIAAHRRGVRVRVAVEGSPRQRHANDAVIEMLREGIGDGLCVVRQPLFMHLHEKLYAFSHPRPAVLVGTFNPSGNPPDDPEIVRRIGDQDRGHNMLVELTGRDAEALFDHARRFHARPHGLADHLAAESEAPIAGEAADAWFFPRRDCPLDARLDALGEGSRLRIAMSHLRDGHVARKLEALSRRGVRVELIAEATRRRVPGWIELDLKEAGAHFRRYEHPDGLPMHNKFLLAEGPQGRWAAFGSYNLTRSSRWLNHEILLFTADPGLCGAFARRWEEMSAEIARRSLALVA